MSGPTLLSAINAPENRPGYVTLCGPYVAWTNCNAPGAIRLGYNPSYVSPPGTTQPLLPATIFEGGAPGALISDGVRYLYYADNLSGDILQIDTLNATTVKPVVVASGQLGVFQMAIDVGYLYWASSINGTVMRLPLSGGSPFVMVSGLSVPWGIAVDSTNAYYTLNVPAAGSDTVFKVALSGGGPVGLASRDGPQFLAQNPSVVYGSMLNIYWTEVGGNVVQFVVGSSTLTVLVSGVPTPWQLAADQHSENVYYTSRGTLANGYTDGYVALVPVGGGATASIQTGVPYSSGIAAATSSLIGYYTVYWSNQGIDCRSGAVYSRLVLNHVPN